MHGIVDLEELTLRCRDEQSRSYVAEAVSCYKTGAFRSCIVSTWNALVFDYLHKLHELEMLSDANAAKHLRAFEKIRAGGESMLKNALDFERSLLDSAEREFELFTPLEKEDLARLQKDRNRCAHPSMQSSEFPFQPTPELARTHLRNAVEIMLSREPVQGKAALDKICSDIGSPYFPTQSDDAAKYLRSGPLARARKPLIRNLLIGITKSFLADNRSENEKLRQISALTAVFQIHCGPANEILSSDLRKCFDSTKDDLLVNLIRYSNEIEIWNVLGSATHLRIENYVKHVSGNDLLSTIKYALHNPHLSSIAVQRLSDLPDNSLASLIAQEKRQVLLEESVLRFSRAGSYNVAKDRMDAFVLPLVTEMNAKHLESLLNAVHTNAQIWPAWGIPGALLRIYDDTKSLRPAVDANWQLFLSNLKTTCGSNFPPAAYSELINRLEQDKLWPL